MQLACTEPEQVAIAGFKEIHRVFRVCPVPNKPFLKVCIEPTVIIVFPLNRREGLPYLKYNSIFKHASWLNFNPYSRPKLARHNAINNVVKIKKKKEIPSIPKVKFKFNTLTHKILVTNWNDVPLALLKKIHKYKEQTKVKQEQFKAINFNVFCLFAGVINNKKVPIKGNISI